MNAFLLETWPRLATAFALLICNAVLVASELSIIKLRFSHFNPDLLDRLRAIPRLAGFLDHADLIVRVIRFSLYGCLLAYALVLIPWLIALFGTLGWMESGEGGTVLFVMLAFLIALCFQYLIAELIPRGLGLRFPIGALRSGYWLIRVLTIIGRPVVQGLTRITRAILRRFGADATADLDSLDMEVQVKLLGEGAQSTSEVIQAILKNTLRMRGLVVSDVLLPRHQVQYMDLNDGIDVNLDLTRKTGHTRFPLCDGDLDRCIGIVNVKDLFRYSGDLRRLDLRRIKRPVIRVGSEDPLEIVLQKLLSQKLHLAIVIDEFGGSQGIITLERILEELVGDIQDEFDIEEEEIQPVGEGVFMVSGLTPIHELEGILGQTISNQDVSTLSGLITAELGRIPVQGEELNLDGLEVRIEEVDEKRVIAAKVRRAILPDPED